MQISISLDYTSITFTHECLIQENISGLSLQYKKNCATSATLVDLNSFITDVDNATNSITLDVSDIDATKTIFDDGVYYFKLTVSGPPVDDTVGTYILTGCIYIGTTTRCKAVCLYETTEDEIYKYIINALSIVNDCDDCECTTQCDLYDYLLTLLNNTSNTSTNVYSSCGCN